MIKKYNCVPNYLETKSFKAVQAKFQLQQPSPEKPNL